MGLPQLRNEIFQDSCTCLTGGAGLPATSIRFLVLSLRSLRDGTGRAVLDAAGVQDCMRRSGVLSRQSPKIRWEEKEVGAWFPRVTTTYAEGVAGGGRLGGSRKDRPFPSPLATTSCAINIRQRRN